VLAPLDADADLDLVVTFRDSNYIAVYFNDGTGAFGPPVIIGMPAGPVSCVAVDVDNDSDLDLAVTSEGGGTLSIVPNNSNGTFGQRVDVATGNWPVSVAAGDFDGDGYADLAVSHLIGGNVRILHNAGVSAPGSFTLTGSLATGSGSFGIVAANLDASPGLDLAVAVFYSSAVFLFSGNGAGGFAPGPVLTVGGGPASVVSHDFDGDGLADLAVSEYFGPTISIFRRTGSATFAPPVSLPTGASPINVGAADLDGDSDLDLLSANHLGSTAGVFYRTPLGANGFGNVGVGAGGPFNHVFINGSAGGRDRIVGVGINQPFTFSVTQPASNPNPTDFIIFGEIGIPNPQIDATVLPFGIGTMCLRPCLLFPAATDLLLLANTYGVPICGPPILPSAAGAWTSVPVSLPFAATATLQGVIFESAGLIRVTNGIVIAIN
jgi:hypothetical protein